MVGEPVGPERPEMTENQNHIYQAMFLLDNQEVRKSFNGTRDWVRNLLEKHGITVRVLRMWGERKLAYPIRQHRRATYLLGWLEGPSDAVATVKREMYLMGPVFRVLFLREEAIPEDELQVGIQDVTQSELAIPEESEDDHLPEFARESAPVEDEKEKKAEPEGEKADAAKGDAAKEESSNKEAVATAEKKED